MIRIPLPKLEQIDGEGYRLLEPMVYYNPVTKVLEEVPIGFETNLLSVPRLLRPFVHPSADIRAAIVHDYLYRYRVVPRHVADVKFLLALVVDEHVSNYVAYACFVAVRLFGRRYYNSGGFANFYSEASWRQWKS